MYFFKYVFLFCQPCFAIYGMEAFRQSLVGFLFGGRSPQTRDSPQASRDGVIQIPGISTLVP